MRWLALAIVGCVACPAQAYDCSSLAAALRAELDAAEHHPLALANPATTTGGEASAAEACDDFARAARALAHSDRDAERGTLAGHHAAAWSDGPHGSGHYWNVALAVDLGGGRVVGACVTTPTTGWRNLSERGHRLFGRWRALGGDRFVVWTTLSAGEALYESLIYAHVYRLRGETLELDRAATLREIDRMGRVYATAPSRPDDAEAAALHRAAAAAYRALVDGASCASGPQR